MPYVYSVAMVKTTLYLPESVKRGIERLAQDRGLSEAEIIRESLARSIAESPPRPRGAVVALGDNGSIDWNSDDPMLGFGEL